MRLQVEKSGPVVVFLGPTLSHKAAAQILEAIYLPPAEQGSVVEAIGEFDPRAILIIDGSFQSAPAVRHKEILWALSLGIPVVGAASMGALRAAELAPQMLGIGLIYRWYRRFPFTPDDAVAVIHGPPEVNSAALTVAQIDLRLTFRAAYRKGLISHDIKVLLDDISRRLNFRDRTMERVLAEARLPRLGSSHGEWLALLNSALVEQKKLDAIRALQTVGRGVPPVRDSVHVAMTSTFAGELKRAGIVIDSEMA